MVWALLLKIICKTAVDCLMIAQVSMMDAKDINGRLKSRLLKVTLAKEGQEKAVLSKE